MYRRLQRHDRASCFPILRSYSASEARAKITYDSTQSSSPPTSRQDTSPPLTREVHHHMFEAALALDRGELPAVHTPATTRSDMPMSPTPATCVASGRTPDPPLGFDLPRTTGLWLRTSTPNPFRATPRNRRQQIPGPGASRHLRVVCASPLLFNRPARAGMGEARSRRTGLPIVCALTCVRGDGTTGMLNSATSCGSAHSARAAGSRPALRSAVGLVLERCAFRVATAPRGIYCRPVGGIR